MRSIKFTRPSSVDEHVRLGQNLNDELDSLWDLEEEKKKSAKDYSDRIKAKELYIRLLQGNLKKHKITMEVECRLQKNYMRGEWVFFDPTTGEEVYSEAFNEVDWLWTDDKDADEVIDKHGLPRAPILPALAKVLQLTSGGDYTDYTEESEQETPAEEVA